MSIILISKVNIRVNEMIQKILFLSIFDSDYRLSWLTRCLTCSMPGKNKLNVQESVGGIVWKQWCASNRQIEKLTSLDLSEIY